MTPEQFSAALKAVGLTQTEFAKRADMSRENVNRWANGSIPIPGWVDWLMEMLQEKRFTC